MRSHIFISFNGDHSFSDKFFAKFQSLVEKRIANIRKEVFYIDNEEVIVDYYYSLISRDTNIVFKCDNGPILIYREQGFTDEQIRFLLKKCEIAKGKLPLF